MAGLTELSAPSGRRISEAVMFVAMRNSLWRPCFHTRRMATARMSLETTNNSFGSLRPEGAECSVSPAIHGGGKRPLLISLHPVGVETSVVPFQGDEGRTGAIGLMGKRAALSFPLISQPVGLGAPVAPFRGTNGCSRQLRHPRIVNRIDTVHRPSTRAP